MHLAKVGQQISRALNVADANIQNMTEESRFRPHWTTPSVQILVVDAGATCLAFTLAPRPMTSAHL